MYNGQFKSFTYGADGQCALNNERRWGDSIVNNHAEHFTTQSKIKNLKAVSNDAMRQSEYFQLNNQQQSRQLDYLQNKLSAYVDVANHQENFYKNKIEEQFLNFSEHATQQENFCGSTLNKQYGHLSQQQQLLQQQQNALEYFENLNEAQANSNRNIYQKHAELFQSDPERFTLEGFENPPLPTPQTQSGAVAPQMQQPGAVAPQMQQPGAVAPQMQQPGAVAPQMQSGAVAPQMQQSANKCFNNEKYESVNQKCKWNTTGLQSYDNEETAMKACNADNNCKGYATSSNKWYLYNPMNESSCEVGEQSYCKRK